VDVWFGLVAFSFISSVTPGPNNVLLWASGAEFGFRRTVPHVVGTAVGIGAMALAAAAGLAALIDVFPQLAVVMKLAGSIYLVYLAIRIAGIRTLSRGVVQRPLTLIGAAAFQVINPKAWIFALGAVTTFRPPDLPAVAGSVLIAVTMMAVIIPSAAIWAGAGEALSRYLTGERTTRIVSLVLAATVVLTVVLVWV
jgi:threonine/homoserine/homoserine lactone efflux protein